MIDVGLSQLVTRFPAASPSGTRPDAIPPATVPMANGVSNEDMAKAAPNRRRRGVVYDTLRKANPAPRATMPNTDSSRGTVRVVMIAVNARGNAVQRTTRQ